MSSRRPTRAVTTTPVIEYVIKPATSRAERQWRDALASEPELMGRVRERLRTRPMDRSDNPNRTHRLKPPLADFTIGDRKLPQWQHEFSSTGRIWYCPDRDRGTVWITRVSFVLPRETHPNRGR